MVNRDWRKKKNMYCLHGAALSLDLEQTGNEILRWSVSVGEKKKKSWKFVNRLPCHEVWLIKVAGAGSGIFAIRWLMCFGHFGAWLDGHVPLSCDSERTRNFLIIWSRGQAGLRYQSVPTGSLPPWGPDGPGFPWDIQGSTVGRGVNSEDNIGS